MAAQVANETTVSDGDVLAASNVAATFASEGLAPRRSARDELTATPYLGLVGREDHGVVGQFGEAAPGRRSWTAAETVP